MQSRRSLLVWKIYGRRLDLWTNDDIPSEELPLGDPRFKTLTWHDKPLPEIEHHLLAGDIDYVGSEMPPPAAVKAGKVAPLTDEDRRTIVRWIDLGCPIDLHPDYDPANATATTSGYIADDHRPTLTLTYPAPGANPALSRILLGMYDFESGLDTSSLQVTADFAIDNIEPGENLASRFTSLPGNRWELKLETPIDNLPRGTIGISVQDYESNVTRIERQFSVQSN